MTVSLYISPLHRPQETDLEIRRVQLLPTNPLRRPVENKEIT